MPSANESHNLQVLEEHPVLLKLGNRVIITNHQQHQQPNQHQHQQPNQHQHQKLFKQQHPIQQQQQNCLPALDNKPADQRQKLRLE
jgi:hypothetical protein